VIPAFIEAHFSNRSNPFDPATNPTGYIGLCVAENKLMWDVLAPQMAARREVPFGATGYDDSIGSEAFRASVARLLSRRVTRRPIDPTTVATLAGAGAILETLFYALCEPGEGVLVPTPSYSGFWADLEGRDGQVIVPVHLPSTTGFAFDTALLDEAVSAAGRPVRALLFTSPDNPLGRVHPAETIDRVLDWCETKRVHAVFDEVYALSVFGDVAFTSVAERRPTLGDMVHLVWAFSKDFAVSGLRAGVLVTENPDVLAAVRAQGMWSMISGDTQWLLGRLVDDDAWVDRYLAEMRHRLAASYRAAAGALDGIGVPYLASDAGFFLLCDLRRFLDGSGWDAEDRLWARMMGEAGVNLTPGAACRVGEPGFFRLCFAAQPVAAVEEAVSRIGRLLVSSSSREP
jgi:aspartate/methionine/tyrosine aminotransferase